MTKKKQKNIFEFANMLGCKVMIITKEERDLINKLRKEREWLHNRSPESPDRKEV